MKKSETMDLYEGLNEISPQMIEEAGNYKKTASVDIRYKKSNNVKKIIAAGLVAAAAVTAVLCMDHPRVLVMATPMTIHEEKLHNLIAKYEDKATIIPLPCPGLMDFVERGDLDGEDLHRYLEDLLYSYRNNQIDAAVLGCTHYPFAREQIQRVLGDQVQIFDGGEGTAREMRRRLAEKGLLREEERRGNIVFQNSLADDTKIALCRRLLQIT